MNTKLYSFFISLLMVVSLAMITRAATPSAARQFSTDIADAVEKAMPSVVVIRTESRKYRVARDWFYGNMHRIPETLVGQGSGVIISKDGYLLTNHHVVDGAEQVEVVLSDGTKLPAAIIGRDHHTDLAVLKIDAPDREFAPMEVGDSDVLRVGEFVIALGSPFSLASSVSLGIVSQKGRSIGLLPFEDFIQTDAAVNRGNSGGPLLDVDGRLVGINTVIQTSGLSAGNIGISFAVPVNLAMTVSASIIRTGRWERPWIGIYMQETARGVEVKEVVAGGPASRGGLMTGDIIRRVDQRSVQKISEIQKAIFTRKIGDPAQLEVERNHDKLALELITETMPIPELILRE